MLRTKEELRSPHVDSASAVHCMIYSFEVAEWVASTVVVTRLTFSLGRPVRIFVIVYANRVQQARVEIIAIKQIGITNHYENLHE